MELERRDIYKLINRSQTSFMPKLRTLVIMQKMIYNLKRIKRGTSYEGAFFLDFAQAFDSLSHRILLEKLQR
jgi:hypothetical protein